jgi:hypothetical protein
MNTQDAKQLFGKSFIGPAELQAVKEPLSFGEQQAPAIPFGEEVLSAHKDTHLLIFTPERDVKGNAITLSYLRDIFGMDPAVSEPCMYNQDWYLKEDFASLSLDGGWHLIRKHVLEETRAQRPDEIESSFKSSESFPSAITLTFAFFAYWFVTGGERLWENDFVWCSDRDHNDDRIYVGRYTDPTGVNKNGFNIHRHLALRPAYSAAPEITS